MTTLDVGRLVTGPVAIDTVDMHTGGEIQTVHLW